MASLRRWMFSRFLSKEGRFYLRTVFLVLAINGGSKVVGFAREVYISSLYGVSRVTDAFFAVQQIPLFAQNYMFGAFNLVFIPSFAHAKQERFAGAFLKALLRVLVSVGFVVAGLMFTGAYKWVPQIVGVAGVARDLAGDFAQILALSILPIVLLGVSYGMLHAERQHVKAMLVELVLPFVMFLSLIGLHLIQVNNTYALPWSFVIGALVAGGCAVYMMRRLVRDAPVSPPQKRRAQGPYLRGFFKQLSASSTENVGFNLNQLLNVYFAGTTGAGSIAVYAYTTRLATFTLNGVVTPLNQMIQAWLSNNETSERRGLHFAFIALAMALLVLLIALLLIAFREPMVRLVYERGAFSAYDTARVAQTLVPYAGYFIVVALRQLYARYFFVISRGGAYTLLSLVGYAISNLLKPFLATSMGLSGVIWACVVGEGVTLLLLIILFVREEGLVPW